MQKYYKILNVNVETPHTEIKKQFRKLSMKHHPDRGGDPVKFNSILEAYRIVTRINATTTAIQQSNDSADEFFKAMFGSKYGPYSRRN